jgi:hypothetical protein
MGGRGPAGRTRLGLYVGNTPRAELLKGETRLCGRRGVAVARGLREQSSGCVLFDKSLLLTDKEVRGRIAASHRHRSAATTLEVHIKVTEGMRANGRNILERRFPS